MRRCQAELISIVKRNPVEKGYEADREVDALDGMRHRLTEASRQLEELFSMHLDAETMGGRCRR